MLVGSGPVGVLARHKWWLIAALAAAVVITLVVTLAARPVSNGQPKQPAVVAAPGPGDRVLQSVNVAMQDDGSLTKIGDNVVISRAAGGSADNVSTTYDPSKAVDNLPVRVLTSYRTADKAGTNLADLKGYTGRATIDLTVENLTVHAQQVHYDVAGQSRTSTAMVGAPLTVVASAALPGTDPSKVVTQATDEATADQATNGVLSQSQDETTQVQWATILAPPQLDATATLRLVVDATDFTLPTIDLSVQPGLVTDPSLGALVDAAFNPKDSTELALESRTIKVIGDVNGVLGRASDTISKVRGTLDSTSKTLGTKTVGDLQASTKDVTTQLKTSRDNLTSLDTDLSSSVKATNSATLSRMAETVSQLNQVLGDTSAAPPAPKVTGTGCDQQVAAADKATSIYASLLQVSAQLTGYASASDACKVIMQQAIVNSIGPRAPNEQDCRDSSSATCLLFAAGSTYATIAGQLDAGQSASADLDPGKLDPIDAQLTDLSDRLDGIAKDTNALLTPDPPADPPADPPVEPLPTFDSVAKSLTDAGDSLTALAKAVDDVHSEALKGQTDATSMGAQNTDLADQLCALVGTGAEPGKLTADQVTKLRSYLATQSCPDPNGDTTRLTPPVNYGAAMEDRLKAQATVFASLAAQTDTSTKTEGIGQPVAKLKTQLADALRALSSDDGSLRSRVVTVNSDLAKATKTLDDLQGQLGEVQTGYGAAKATLDKALQDGQDTTSAATLDLPDKIVRIAEQGDEDSANLGAMLDRSRDGLSAAADKIQSDGANAIKEQQQTLSESQAKAEKSLTASSKLGLTQVSSDVRSATRDLDATKTLLTKDLASVLLDLGSRKARGSGVLGLLATSATAAGSADYQLGLASDKSSAYATARARDLEGVLLRQAQAEAALERQADLPPFVMQLPPTVEHRTIYLFHVDGGR